MGSRVLKIYGYAPYSTFKEGYREKPSIRLQGRWLERLGFKVGNKLEVSYVSEGQLWIRLVKEESD